VGNDTVKPIFSKIFSFLGLLPPVIIALFQVMTLPYVSPLAISTSVSQKVYFLWFN